MFLPTGATMFLGSLYLNQTPIPVVALESPLKVHEPSVNVVVLKGDLGLWFLLAGARDLLLGSMKILRWSWRSPVEVTHWLNILMFSGSLIAWIPAAWRSSI